MFDRPIGKNQAVQFPIAESYIEIEAANLMRFRACALFDAREPCGAEANMAKLRAAKASWEAANVLGPRRVQVRQRVRRGRVSGTLVSGGADFDELDPVLRCQACSGCHCHSEKQP